MKTLSIKIKPETFRITHYVDCNNCALAFSLKVRGYKNVSVTPYECSFKDKKGVHRRYELVDGSKDIHAGYAKFKEGLTTLSEVKSVYNESVYKILKTLKNNTPVIVKLKLIE